MADTDSASKTHDVTCTYCGTEWELNDDEVQCGVFFCEDCSEFFNIEEGQSLYKEMCQNAGRKDESLESRFYLHRLRKHSRYRVHRRLIRIGLGVAYVIAIFLVTLIMPFGLAKIVTWLVVSYLFYRLVEHF